MKTFREAAGALREPTALEAQAVAEVYELVDRFTLGTITTAEIRAATKGKQRWLATRFTPPGHPHFEPLMAMLDALIAEDDSVIHTKHGTFSLDELWPFRIDYESGAIQFPIRQPWRIEPDEKAGITGERGEPVYEPRRRQQTEAEPAPREWWEADE